MMIVIYLAVVTAALPLLAVGLLYRLFRPRHRRYRP